MLSANKVVRFANHGPLREFSQFVTAVFIAFWAEDWRTEQLLLWISLFCVVHCCL